MTEYAIIIHRAGGNYSAHCPDVPGCIAAGDTIEETVQLMQEALEDHLAVMVEDGDPVPEAGIVRMVCVPLPLAAGRAA